MKLFYDFIFLIFAFVSIPKFWVRLSQAASRPELVGERFGRFQKTLRQKFSGRKVVWLHAVSVGELMASRQWLQLFLAAYPDWMVALSTTTPTGRGIAETLASERVAVFYAPFDLSRVVRRVLSCIRPRLILLMETEIWPNLISEASSAGIPIGILNGRISPRSFQRYRWVRFAIAPILQRLSFCLVQSERDRDYFLKLGMPELRIFYTGNMKFDRFDLEQNRELRTRSAVNGARWDGLVFIGGSTSWNEEELLLKVFRRLRGAFPNLRLVLAPRHPERLSKVMNAIRHHKFQYQLFSQNHSGEPRPVLLIDRMGVLASLYSSADIVFVGGSFVRRGGQNPMEAAFSKKPLLHGPHVFNFYEAYRMLDEKGAAFQVHSQEELFLKSKMLLERPEIREQMGAQAWSTVQSMKGATARTLDYLASWMHVEEQAAAVVP